MRPCQVCGCASWGPIGNASELKRLEEFLPNAKGYDFVRCDNCKAIARADLLQESAPTPDPAPDAGFPGIVSDLFKHVMPAVPEPPTRTERLVSQILRSNPRGGSRQSSADYAQWIVALARVIEWELDHPTGPNASEASQAETPWLVLSFPSQEEFQRWCTTFWDFIHLRDCVGLTTAYPVQWYVEAVKFVQGKEHAN